MPEMKDSGIEFIGDIPADWEVLRVKNIGSYRNGLTYSPSDLCDPENGTLVLRSSNIRNGKLVFDDNVYVSSSIPSELWLKENDILICSRNGSQKLVGKSAMINNVTASFGAFMMVLRCNELCEPKYAYYILNSDVFGYYLGTFFTSTINQLTGANFGNMSIPFCSNKGIQKQIADFLDSKCAEIDALVADIQSEIEILEEYKKSVITEAVTKGLNSAVQMKDSGIEWAAKVPEHWKIMANKYVMKKVKEISPKYSGEDILSLTMNGVIVRDLDAGGKMPATFDGYQRVYAGNLLMCLFDYDVTPRCIGLVKNNGLTSPAYSQFVMKNGNSAKYYYYYYLMIDNTKELLHLAKNLRHSFTEEQLGAINTPVPPIEEQVDIANYLDVKIEQIEQTIGLKKEQLETLEEYKKSVIYEYVTGKKEVPLS